MATNDNMVRWPLSPAEWARIERNARAERARATSQMLAAVGSAFKRLFGGDGMVTIYVPSVKGGRLTG